MEIRKERSIVKIFNGEKLMGGFDFSTGGYIGTKGTQLKGISVPFTRELNELTDNLAHCMTEVLDGLNRCAWSLDGTEKTRALQRAEQLISLGLHPAASYDTWRFMARKKQPALTKDLVNYLKETHDNKYDEQTVLTYTEYKREQEFYDEVGIQALQWVTSVLASTAAPLEWARKMAHQAIREKISFDYASYSFATLLDEWADKIKTMGEKLEVPRNILTQYCILKWRYKEYYNAKADIKLKENNDCPFLYYENDNYIVRPLISKNDFHQEAEAQHNCVERLYMERVVLGQTHVVSVRLKNRPDNSYITCEVNNNGHIQQFLLACNNYIHTTEDKAFRAEYQNHLLSSLKNTGE